MDVLIVLVGMILLAILVAVRVKPAYALIGVSVVVGFGLQMPWRALGEAIFLGFWSTLVSVGFVLLTGAWLGKLVEASGATSIITRTLVRAFGESRVEWAVMLTGFLVGIPLFYNVGFVILIPLVFSISATLRIPVLRVGIPMAASLSVTHGFLPPHPAPTSIASIFQADLFTTLVYGLIIALPAAIVAGPAARPGTVWAGRPIFIDSVHPCRSEARFVCHKLFGGAFARAHYDHRCVG